MSSNPFKKAQSAPLLLCCVLAAGFALAGPSAFAQQEGGAAPPASGPPAQTAQEKKKNERKLIKELDNSYRKWLEEDVVYIITPQERRAFLELSTNEEREQFIEGFWQRRNPDPDSPDNTVKEEHYRRIAYANERFSSGIPGWRTDRGRTYIMWGPPDQIDSHPAGPYSRTPEEGGGETTTYAFEDWRYRYLEGIGDDVNLEFIDPSGSGEFRLTIDPCEKDALSHVPNGGMTWGEIMGASTQAQRFQNTDGTTCAPNVTNDQTPEGNREFDRITTWAKIQAPPPIKFKEPEALVTSKVLRNQINFEYRFDFLRVTSDTVLVPITIEVPNRYLTFQAKDGVHSAQADVFMRITTLTGRRVQTSDEPIKLDYAEALFRQSVGAKAIYQKAVPLRPGQYRLDVVVKDVNSGNTGVVSTALRVPRYDDEKLSTSTLILADQIERVASKQIGLGQFVIGDSKVRPRMDQQFNNQERVGIYVQVYNLSVDEKTHKSDVVFDFTVSRVQGNDSSELFHKSQTSAELGQTGQQVTLEKMIPLSQFEPGRYKLTVLVTDNISKQSISPNAEFTVKPSAPAAAKNN